MENLEEKFVSRTEIYDGAVLKVVCDDILLPNGKPAKREYCMHVGAVAILPIDEEGRVLVERQYRYPHHRVFLEIPAGKLNYKGENPLDAAKRELAEETGARAARWDFLGNFETSPAITDEEIGLFLARELTFGERNLDEDEFLDCSRVPLSELVERVMACEIHDAKTQLAILKVNEYLKRENKALTLNEE